MARSRKLSDEQREENKNSYNIKYKKEHREQTLYTNSKSRAKNFILKKSTKEDLLYLQNLITERLKEF